MTTPFGNLFDGPFAAMEAALSHGEHGRSTMDPVHAAFLQGTGDVNKSRTVPEIIALLIPVGEPADEFDAAAAFRYEDVQEWVNLTGKDINFCTLGGEPLLYIPDEGYEAEITETNLLADEAPIDSVLISVYSKDLAILGLPEDPDPQKVYFVTREVALAARVNNRATYDLLIPTTPVRTTDGTIIGFRHVAYLLA